MVVLGAMWPKKWGAPRRESRAVPVTRPPQSPLSAGRATRRSSHPRYRRSARLLSHCACAAAACRAVPFPSVHGGTAPSTSAAPTAAPGGAARTAAPGGAARTAARAPHRRPRQPFHPSTAPPRREDASTHLNLPSPTSQRVEGALVCSALVCSCSALVLLCRPHYSLLRPHLLPSLPCHFPRHLPHHRALS